MVLFNYYFEPISTFPVLNVTSAFFIIFVFGTSLISYFWKSILKPYVLFLASIVFIWSYSNDFYYLFIVLAYCIFGYIFGLLLSKFKNKILLALSILIVVTALCFFKYSYLIDINNIIMPLGISFYTFKLISYLVSVYNGKVSFDYNPIYVFDYLLFFPSFVSGPILKPKEFINELKEKKSFDFKEARRGWMQLLYGIFEKIVICDYFGLIVTATLDNSEISGLAVLLGVFLYALQIYLDFDSYSNIAIGASRLFGFNISDNFKTPYLSRNLKEFWSRWHISLSEWLKEYIYIPLGGNKKGTVRKYINILVVFLISGVWHGSYMNFIVWGLLHGIIRIIEDIIDIPLKKVINIDNIFFSIIRVIINFVIVCLLWLVFRSSSIEEVVSILNRISTTSIDFESLGFTYYQVEWMIILIVFVFIIDLIRYKWDLFKITSKTIFIVRYAIYIIFIFVFLIFGVYGGSFNSADFIYRWF